jgi:hypothetical protein
MGNVTPGTDSLPKGAPVFYTVDEVAAILRLDTPRHLIRNAARLPHVQIAGRRLFTAEHVAQIAAMHERNVEPVEHVERPAFASVVKRGAHSP